MKNSLSILVICLIVWGMYSFVNADKYLGFYYPDRNNLLEEISSVKIFNSLESCREWANEQASILNPNDSEYDYECGKNCDTSGGKPYICEETLR
jgi:hypothetical protein